MGEKYPGVDIGKTRSEGNVRPMVGLNRQPDGAVWSQRERHHRYDAGSDDVLRVSSRLSEHARRNRAAVLAGDDQGRTPLTWVREWPEAPTQKKLAEVIERLQTVRKLDCMICPKHDAD
jgi:hypothetical protein